MPTEKNEQAEHFHRAYLSSRGVPIECKVPVVPDSPGQNYNRSASFAPLWKELQFAIDSLRNRFQRFDP